MTIAAFVLGFFIAYALQYERLYRAHRNAADLRAQVAELWAQMTRAGVEYRPWQ